MTETILVIDDDPNVRELVMVALTEAGYEVLTAATGDTGVVVYQAHRPDLVVLDLGLGSVDGLDVCRRMRADGNVPIILLTSRSDEADQLVGFAAGADDYVTKPFSAKILVARVATQLRRHRKDDDSAVSRLSAGPILVDLDARTVTVDAQPVELTRMEFDLLVALMEHPAHVVTREVLLERVWGAWFGDPRVVEVSMSRLRKKIREAGGPSVGQAVRGVGYRLGLENAAG